MDSQKIFLVLVAGLLGIIIWFMLQPFLPYILSAMVLAFLLHPIHERLRNYVPPSISAFSLLVFTILLAIVPLVLVTGAVVDDVRDIQDSIGDVTLIDFGPFEGWVEDVTGQEIDITEILSEAVEGLGDFAFGGFSQAIDLIIGLSIGLLVLFFLLYYLVKDGEKFIAWMKNITPVDNEIQENLYRKTNRATWAVMKGHVFVAVAQGLIAGLGFYAVGIPNYLFWTFIMVILAFIPLIGTFIVWAPAAVYLIIMGNVASGVALAVYGLIVVSMTDNVLRPLVVDKAADIHPAAVLIGVLGGVFLFGAPGLFIGPVIIGVLKSVLTVYSQEYG